MGAKRRPWLYHEEFMDHHLGGAHPSGIVWTNGAEVWHFMAEGITAAAASTVIPITGLPAGAEIGAVLPMFPAATIEFAPNVWQPSSTIDAANLQLVLILTTKSISLNHAAAYQSKPFTVMAHFTLT